MYWVGWVPKPGLSIGALRLPQQLGRSMHLQAASKVLAGSTPPAPPIPSIIGV